MVSIFCSSATISCRNAASMRSFKVDSFMNSQYLYKFKYCSASLGATARICMAASKMDWTASTFSSSLETSSVASAKATTGAITSAGLPDCSTTAKSCSGRGTTTWLSAMTEKTKVDTRRLMDFIVTE
eukprot:Protomagalhaensia_wolfi_Nauph_80__2510@NODE_2672_length_1020_cov_8201_550459_g2092_i0_p2_GENE_NODE_2672_length_1020_cov_8201_550459_g2092_i0NODE_2672_length_1020_cov_8201_550459_g2092_i0_p2_ORF_typecomplete_len128_score14_68DUF1604/PF07713_13/2e03DUF1604/PF07713_13/3DUF1604/PF07713_13/2_7e02_NODE_2672_length_1020_cov_8201_550459_g2092_i0301684